MKKSSIFLVIGIVASISFLVMLFAITLVRAGMARLRITQVVTVYWITITLIALLGLVLLMWDNQFYVEMGWW